MESRQRIFFMARCLQYREKGDKAYKASRMSDSYSYGGQCPDQRRRRWGERPQWLVCYGKVPTVARIIMIRQNNSGNGKLGLWQTWWCWGERSQELEKCQVNARNERDGVEEKGRSDWRGRWSRHQAWWGSERLLLLERWKVNVRSRGERLRRKTAWNH